VSLFFPFHAIRFQGPFATIAVVIAGSVLASSAKSDLLGHLWERIAAAPLRLKKVQLKAACLIVLSAFVTMRGFDLVTNRFYLHTHYAWALFGAGVSPWYPEKAAEFVKEAELPGNLFNDYTAGGFVAWRLGPKYRDYIDGRGNGGGSLFFRSQLLLQSGFDSDAWRNESDLKLINTVFVTVDYEIAGGLASLNQYCKSSNFQLVFLDTKAAVFVRKTQQTELLLRDIGKQCATVRLDSPPAGTTLHAKAERFLYFRNAAAILITLNRDSDSLTNSSAALDICPDCGDAHFIRAVALYSSDPGKAEVQKELELSVKLDPGDLNSEFLAGEFRRSGRFREAFDILDSQIDRSSRPFRLLMLRGFVEVDLNSLDAALHSFDEAEKNNPFHGEDVPVGKQFRAELAQGRANAWWKIATNLERQGLHEQANRARDHYESFQQQVPPAE
jgi:hypothetical protein